MGATEESIREVHGAEEEDFHVWPENWEAFTAFITVSTQWAMAPAGGCAALDYARVESGLRLAGIPASRELFDKLRIIERACLAAMNSSGKGA